MGTLHKLPRRKLTLNTIYCADNLEVMKQLPGESIDLIYIDPPFCTQAVQKSKAWDSNVQSGQFDDRWGGGINSYVLWLSVRLREMHRLLKPTGSLFVHLDQKAVHYIKIELDKIFGDGDANKGMKLFRNDIIWSYGAKATPQKKMFPKKHDNILFYTKSNKYKFEPIIVPYSKASLRERDTRYKFENEKGLYRMTTRRNAKGEKYRAKVYLNKGVPETDVWRLPIINSTAKERLGYPTQKPLSLLERIIQAASNKGDVVADFFCGCGTAVSAAYSLDRNWIGVDASKQATSVIRKRMAKEHNIKIDVTPLKSLTKAQILKMPPFEFEKYAVQCIGGIPNDIQVGDGGIDGRLQDGTPIQVKMSDRVGRPVIDSFHKHMEHNGRGIVIAKSFGKGAKEEVSKLLLEKGWEITLVTVDDLIRDAA